MKKKRNIGWRLETDMRYEKKTEGKEKIEGR